MFELSTLLWLIPIGLLAGMTGPITAASSLFTIPCLILLGFDVKHALAIQIFASFIAWLVVTKHMLKAKHIRWEFVPAFLILAVTGSAVGTFLAVQTPSDALKNIVGVFIIFASTLLIFARKVGTEEKVKSKKSHIIGLFLNFGATLYAGFFAGGSGIMLRTINLVFFGFTIIQSAATGGFIWVFIAGVSTFIYALNGYLNLDNIFYAITLAASMAIGSNFGSKAMLVMQPRLVKNFFVIFAVLSGLWIIFQS